MFFKCIPGQSSIFTAEAFTLLLALGQIEKSIIVIFAQILNLALETFKMFHPIIISIVENVDILKKQFFLYFYIIFFAGYRDTWDFLAMNRLINQQKKHSGSM